MTNSQKKLDLIQTSSFKKDVKRLQKQGKDLALLKEVIRLLQEQKPLPKKHKDHNLIGKWNGFRECHIEPDWLLIYMVNTNELILTLSRSGSHSELLRI